ncbi:hypothetical protein BAUCODRAFT_121175 [Baudoinia panamericana UAMH 10762]|uniref:Transcription initiation factor IIE subunit beta n=1 Tax=Baudoinia panamericana (strain UAMH 10762) TaxID=717646 RepID=M2N2W4_BAUPA|nr:uncharacterized protein BAUCODRAFT_121175 [Baudoinia panamericana UAMH 10762]EMC98298.1 hypothetical protein BAUCODRAFT_121175 [Baudoinia panamericana UAMH 10762]
MDMLASLNRFQADRAEAAARNLPQSRPAAAPARTSTPKPAPAPPEKRTHDAAFPAAPTGEIFKVVVNTVEYLKGKNAAPVPFEEIIRYLSLPVDLQRKQETIKRALRTHNRVQQITIDGKESFKYRPQHDVTNGDELLSYLARQDSAAGIPVKELKDGWPDCVPTLKRLEADGQVLLTSNKKDGVPRVVYADDPSYYPASTSSLKGAVDPEFVDFWSKIRLPANENDIRVELERAGLTPTSAVREVKKVEMRKDKKRRAEKKNAKKTNVHLAGVLKDYSKLKQVGR